MVGSDGDVGEHQCPGDARAIGQPRASTGVQARGTPSRTVQAGRGGITGSRLVIVLLYRRVRRRASSTESTCLRTLPRSVFRVERVMGSGRRCLAGSSASVLIRSSSSVTGSMTLSFAEGRSPTLGPWGSNDSAGSATLGPALSGGPTPGIGRTGSLRPYAQLTSFRDTADRWENQSG